MFRFSTGELVIVFLIILLLFGASRLPAIARSLGKSIKEFKKAGKEIKSDIEEVTREEVESKEKMHFRHQ